MAGNLSTAGAELVRKWLFCDAAASRPTQWFLALYSSAPGDTGGGTELSGSGYARQAIAFDPAGAANEAEIVFGPASADWPAITHGAIFDGTGRFLAWQALSASKTIPSGDTLRFAADTITAEFD